METMTKPYLNWEDFGNLFQCGRSKAMLLMHEVGVVYIGRVAFVRAADLEAYLDDRGSIDIRWPKKAVHHG
jgi:hypothetical protein